MAKIVVSHFSPVLDNGEYQSLVYYDALVKALVAEGNQVTQIISTDFLDQPWNGHNEVKSSIDSAKLTEYFKNNSPELLIVFNNSIPKCILEAVECPITLWHGDAFKFFNDKDYIYSNIERFHFICPFDDTAFFLKNMGVSDEKIIKLLPATGVVSENKTQNKNISFIGSPFISGYKFYNYLKEGNDREYLREIANLFLSPSASQKIADLKSEVRFQELLKRIPYEELSSLYSSEKRILTLSLISHLGIEVFGGKDWYETALYHPWLAMSYNPQKVYSLSDNQDVYNTSKISINISHTQATVGFPWRVMDIMASNSLLVSDSNSGIAEFTNGYVKIPMYDNPTDAYMVCKRLLRDEAERTDLVLASQECIRNKGRWTNRFADLQEALSINIVNCTDRRGQYERLSAQNFVKEPPSPIFVETKSDPQQRSNTSTLKDIVKTTPLFPVIKAIHKFIK